MLSGAPGELLRRDRQLVSAALVAVAVTCWAYTLLGVGMDASSMRPASVEGTPGVTLSGATAPATTAFDTESASGWSIAESTLMLAMWWIMMIAMMLPSAAPTMLLAAALNRRAEASRPPFGSTASFASGYLLVWLAFSLGATALHAGLEAFGLLGMMRSSSPTLSGALLLGAGLWQYTPIKRACLSHCRSPARFLVAHRRRGDLGALAMGVRHGAYCLGCCWLLMLLLFVGGVMSAAWIGALALFVLIEKRWARGESFGRISGALLLVAGALVLVAGVGS